MRTTAVAALTLLLTSLTACEKQPTTAPTDGDAPAADSAGDAPADPPAEDATEEKKEGGW